MREGIGGLEQLLEDLSVARGIHQGIVGPTKNEGRSLILCSGVETPLAVKAGKKGISI